MSVLLGDVVLPSPEAPTTLTKAFQEVSSTQKDKVAIVSDEGMVSYESLEKWVKSITQWIKDKGGGGWQDGRQPKSSCQNEIKVNCQTKKSKKVNCGGKKKASKTNVKENTSDSDCIIHVPAEERASDVNVNIGGTNEHREATAVDVVAICLDRRAEVIPLILAIWRMGLAFVALDTSLPSYRVSQIMKSCRPSVMVGDSHTCPPLKALVKGAFFGEAGDREYDAEATTLGTNNSRQNYHFSNGKVSENTKRYTVGHGCRSDSITILNIDEHERTYKNRSLSSDDLKTSRTNQISAPDEIAKPTCDHFREDESLACIVYISGDSSCSNCVRLTHRNLLNRINWQLSILPFERNEVCMLTGPLTSIDSIAELFIPVLGGVPIVITKKDLRNPQLLVKTICQLGVTRLLLIPPSLKTLLKFLRESSSSAVLDRSIKLWSVTGEPLRAELLTEFYDVFPDGKLASMFGCPETSGVISCYGVTERCLLVNGRVPVGSPLHNNAVMILSEDGGKPIVPDEGKLGEIVCLGLNVCDGYLPRQRKDDRDETKFNSLNEIGFADKLCMENVIDFCQDIENVGNSSRKDSSQSDVSVKVEGSIFDTLLLNQKLHEKMFDHLNVNIAYLTSSTARRRSSGTILLVPGNYLRSRSSSMCSSLLTAAPSMILSSIPRRSSMPPSLSGSARDCSNKHSTSNTSLMQGSGILDGASNRTSRASSPAFRSVSERASPTRLGGELRRSSHTMPGHIDRCQSIPMIICPSTDEKPSGRGASKRLFTSLSAHNVGSQRSNDGSSASKPNLMKNFAPQINVNPSQVSNRSASPFKRPSLPLPEDIYVKTVSPNPGHSDCCQCGSSVTKPSRQSACGPRVFKIENTKWKVFKTGCVGRIIGGVLILEGRTDSKINIGGSLVDTRELEEAIKCMSCVSKCCVLVLTEPKQAELIQPLNQDPSDNTSPVHSRKDNLRGVEKHGSELQGILKSESKNPKPGTPTRDICDKDSLPLRESRPATKPKGTMPPSTAGTPTKPFSLQSQTEEEESRPLLTAAFVVLTRTKGSHGKDLKESLMSQLRTLLPKGLMPLVMALETLPTLSSGEPDKRALEWQLKQRRREAGYSWDEMVNEGFLSSQGTLPLESRVLHMVCEVLGLSYYPSLLQESLESLGASTLATLNLYFRIQELDFNLTLERFLKATSLADLVHSLLKAKTMAEVVTLFSPCISPVPCGTPIGGGASLGGNTLVGFGRTLGALLGDTNLVKDGDSSSDEEDTESEDSDGNGGRKGTSVNEMTLSSSGMVEVVASTEISEDVREQMRRPDSPVVETKISSDKIKLSSPKESPKRSKKSFKLKIMPLKEDCPIRPELLVLMDRALCGTSSHFGEPAAPIGEWGSLLGTLWSEIVGQNLSFFVASPQGKPLGVMLNVDLGRPKPTRPLPALLEPLVLLHSELEEQLKAHLLLLLQDEGRHTSPPEGDVALMEGGPESRDLCSEDITLPLPGDTNDELSSKPQDSRSVPCPREATGDPGIICPREAILDTGIICPREATLGTGIICPREAILDTGLICQREPTLDAGIICPPVAALGTAIICPQETTLDTGIWLQNIVLATAMDLTVKESLRVTLLLHSELEKIRARHQMRGVTCIIAHPAIQLLHSRVLGYQQVAALSLEDLKDHFMRGDSIEGPKHGPSRGCLKAVAMMKRHQQ